MSMQKTDLFALTSKGVVASLLSVDLPALRSRDPICTRLCRAEP